MSTYFCDGTLANPSGVYVDEAGHLYIADTNNHRIRRVDAGTGDITTVAGTGEQGFSGDGEPAIHAGLNEPRAVYVDGAGHLYIADSGNHRIRKVNLAPTAVAERIETDQTPSAFSLAQNYPNPFNPQTRIRYEIPVAGPVSLTIYNMLGQRIGILSQEQQAAGFYEVSWDGKDSAGRDVADGVYVYRLSSDARSFAGPSEGDSGPGKGTSLLVDDDPKVR